MTEERRGGGERAGENAKTPVYKIAGWSELLSWAFSSGAVAIETALHCDAKAGSWSEAERGKEWSPESCMRGTLRV